MSEQQPQGAEQALDLNNELQSRREKLAALRENGIAFPNDFRRDTTSDISVPYNPAFKLASMNLSRPY